MLTLQSSESQIVYLLIMKVKLDNYGLQGVSFTEIQEGLSVRRKVSALRLLIALRKVLSALLGFCPKISLSSLSLLPR